MAITIHNKQYNFYILDKIYQLIKNKDYHLLSNYNDLEINTVIALRFDSSIKEAIYIEKNTNNRDNSSIFRTNVAKMYNNRCKLTKMELPGCQACHIYPYANCKFDEDKKTNLNGILLSSTLHDIFDKNYFYIDEVSCCIIIKITEYDELNKLLNQIKGKYIKELDNVNSKKYIKNRNQLYKN